MQTKEQPIGIFDSGIGGLTVAKAIRTYLPKESILYFGDTKHLPYGDKSPKVIEEYSLKIAEFLKKNHCKMIVIACNTASSLAYNTVKNTYPDIELVNVIDPVVKKKYLPNSCVGVIGTKGTIQSGIYQRKINKKDDSIKVKSLATPLLAAMIEEGFFKDEISQAIIQNYLNKKELKGIEQLILACTHYPLIQESINTFYKKKVTIIDSASEVAKYVHQVLTNNNLLSQHHEINDHFYVSDYTKSFEESAKYFFGNDITLEEISLSL